MLEVKQVTVILSNPVGEDDTGCVTIGYYTIKDGLLTMTDGNGAPVRPGISGDLVTHRLKPGEQGQDVARRLTVKIFRTVRGEGAGFNRPLVYPKGSVA